MAETNCIHHGEHESRIKRLEQDVCELEGARENHTDIIGKMNERLAIVDQSSRSAHHRLNAQEEQTKAISDLAASVKMIAARLEELIASIKNHGERLETLERQPALDAYNRQKRAKELAFSVTVTAIVSGALAYLVALSKLVR